MVVPRRNRKKIYRDVFFCYDGEYQEEGVVPLLQKELLYALLGTGFTCAATILGAAMVFFFR